jgi:CRP-like cAMP-binding protein
MINAVKKFTVLQGGQMVDDDSHKFTAINDEKEPDIEDLDEEQDVTKITAATILKTLPSDVTLIVQNNAYSLEVLESYKRIISEEMRSILQNEGHRAPNFRRYGEILRNITTAIKLRTDFIRDLFRRLIRTTPDELAKATYATILHYQKSLCDYQEIITHKQARLNKELRVIKSVLAKLDTTFIILRKRAQEISELISSVTDAELNSYPPDELEEFRAILGSVLDEETKAANPGSREISRQALIKVLEAIGIQALSFKENRKYQNILRDIEWHLGTEKAAFVSMILARFALSSPQEISRQYEATIIKHNLFLLSHFTLLLDSQENLHIIEQYNNVSRRLSEALNIKLTPYKAKLGLRICDDLVGIYPDELAAYQTYERIQEYHNVLETSITASESEGDTQDLLIRQKTLVKVLEAEGIQTLMWEDPEKHKKYQEILTQIEKNVLPFKDEFLKERLERFSGLTSPVIAQKYRVNTIKHNVLLLARLSLLLNRQENVDLMFDYYSISKNIFEALNLKLEESKILQEDNNAFRSEAKAVLLESDLFRTLSNIAIERIVDKFILIKKEEGTTVIQKGQKGDAFFVIKNGRMKVSLPSKGGKEIRLATLNKSDCFGEMSLLTGNPASASISALEDVELLKLSEANFNDMLLEYPVLNRYFHRILSERLHDASGQPQSSDSLRGLSGKLSTISLEELIQTLYTANKTGVLTIDNHGDKGRIYIKNGLVIHAITKSLKGEQAFFRVMTWHDATFRFVPGEVDVERTVTMNVHGLLLEAMKRIDDMRQIKHL